MSKPNPLDEFFQRPFDLPDNDAITAQIMREVARVARQRKVLLVGSGVAGTGVALGIVLWANVLPTLASSVGNVGAAIERYFALEPLPASFGLWMLAAASLVAMGLAAALFSHEP